MPSASSRPRLRPVETIVVQDRRLGRALMLRDTQGVTSSHAVLPLEVVPILERFTGTMTCDEIATQASRELGEYVPVEVVVKLATELEEALFVEGEPYRRERARIEREFAAATVREPSHAGGAYHDDPADLAEYIDVECLGTRAPAPGSKRHPLTNGVSTGPKASASSAPGSKNAAGAKSEAGPKSGPSAKGNASASGSKSGANANGTSSKGASASGNAASSKAPSSKGGADADAPSSSRAANANAASSKAPSSKGSADADAPTSSQAANANANTASAQGVNGKAPSSKNVAATGATSSDVSSNGDANGSASANASNANGKGVNGKGAVDIAESAATSANGSGTSKSGGSEKASRKLVGLVAPHIDPWRGARCYGAAYNALTASLAADVDTFILLGTSHAPMRQPFALCRKTFGTPLGPMEADFDSIDAIAAACDFDPYADQFNHKREHSLEFQAVFLRHLLAKRNPTRKARIIPILAGLNQHQQSGDSPSTSRAVTRFFDAVRKVIDTRGAVLIAGADLAHVGPRFGDPRPLDESERFSLDAVDRDSLGCAERVDAEAFWEHVASDLDTRRVCGLGPMYTLLRTIDPSAQGEVRHYEQTIDPDEGSIVSHAAVGFYL